MGLTRVGARRSTLVGAIVGPVLQSGRVGASRLTFVGAIGLRMSLRVATRYAPVACGAIELSRVSVKGLSRVGAIVGADPYRTDRVGAIPSSLAVQSSLRRSVRRSIGEARVVLVPFRVRKKRAA